MTHIYKLIKNKNFLSLAGNGIMSIINMIILSALYRFLSIKDNGIWIFFQSSLVFIDTFRTGFLITGFIKFYSGSVENRKNEVLGSAWFVSSIITFLFILLNLALLLVAKRLQNPGLIFLLKWFSINLICTLPSLLAICVAQAQQRFDRLLYLRMCGQLLFLLFIVILKFYGAINLDNVIYANLLASLITSLLTIILGWSGIKYFMCKTKACSIELYNYGKYTVGTSISASLFRITDTLIINMMLGPAALAIYNLGNRLMELIEIPLRSFAATALPILSAAYNLNKKDSVIFGMKRYIGLLTFALIPICIGAFLFADVAINIIGGEKYIGTEAANVLRLFMTFALIYPADRFFALTLDAINLPKINFIKVIIMLIINIVTDYIGVYFFKNIYGITLATIFPILAGTIIGYYAIRKYKYFRFWSIYDVGFGQLKQIKKRLKV